LRWTVPLALAAAVGAVLVATLASPNKASADVVIAGARSISDPVLIAYGVKKQGTTTDVHVLAFNDLHGNLEAAGNNIYGHFAGGAAYLAKAIKDRQAQYGG
jgi:2',3'-cyclic-nucleotide 2'-phosphodiesterase (5'-nucleotidase family)